MSKIETNITGISRNSRPEWLKNIQSADDLRSEIFDRYNALQSKLLINDSKLVYADEFNSKDPYDYGSYGEGRYRAARLEGSEIIYWFWLYESGQIVVESSQPIEFNAKLNEIHIKISVIFALLMNPNDEDNKRRALKLGWDINMFNI